MSQIHSYIQSLANATPADAATIAGDAAMTIKKSPVHTTTKASTSIQNLTPGVSLTYRQRVLLKTGLSDWSQPISALVT